VCVCGVCVCACVCVCVCGFMGGIGSGLQLQKRGIKLS